MPDLEPAHPRVTRTAFDGMLMLCDMWQQRAFTATLDAALEQENCLPQLCVLRRNIYLLYMMTRQSI